MMKRTTLHAKIHGRDRIDFEEPIRGPICLGHSSHFGMGLFVPQCSQ